jgi:hypothetical protein
MKMKLHLLAVLAVITLSAVLAVAQTPPFPGLKAYTDTYTVQHPYNLPESARFSISPGPVYNTFILKGDKGFTPTTTTGPRTEMRWNTNWTVTEHFWEADVLIDSGSQGSAIMQVHATACACEPIYVQVISGGNVRNDNGSTIIAPAMWGKWFHMIASYDPTSGDGHIWINGKLVLTRHDPHPLSTVWYFKNGVYGITGTKSETHYKNIRFWTR